MTQLRTTPRIAFSERSPDDPLRIPFRLSTVPVTIDGHEVLAYKRVYPVTERELLGYVANAIALIAQYQLTKPIVPRADPESALDTENLRRLLSSLKALDDGEPQKALDLIGVPA